MFNIKYIRPDLLSLKNKTVVSLSASIISALLLGASLIASPFSVANDHDHDQEHSHHNHNEEARGHSTHEADAHNTSHEDHDHEHSAHNPIITANPQGYADKRRPNMVIPAHISNKTQIAISNYPLFLLSEAVTKGAPSGKLLLQPGDVGHHGSLSPSDIKTVKDSRYVVWFGEQLESNLTNSLAKSPNNISLFRFNAFNRHHLRNVKGQPIEGTLDPHIWLDPDNAKAITRALGVLYSRANPEYKAIYAANVQNFAQQMDAAVAKVKKSTSAKPYWAYHDAFSYIEPTMNLSFAGALTADHHIPPKASQFHWLNKNRPQKTMCMILLADNNKGALNKLTPVNSTVIQEDMSVAKDFISGWLAMAREINTCVN